DEVAARLGVSRAQVTRIENRGYDLCSLNTLRRYVIALGCGLELSVAVRKVDVADTPEKRHLPARI
ncbi:MAG: helix-turn-helix domain-containing protein, partial [Chloroflexota bacterium]